MNEMYGRKNLDRVAGDVHLYLLASINRLKANDFQDFRRLFQSFAQKAEDAPVKPQLQQVEEKKMEDWKPVSWDKRAEYLKMVQAEIDRIDDKKIRPLLDGEAEANGQYDLPKPKAKCAPSAPVDVVLEHINKVNAARRKFYLERHPDATEEEVQAYIDKFDKI